MPSTIITKNGSGAPLAADLVAGELAVDLTNGRLYTEDTGGSVIEIGLNPSGNVDVTGTVTADGLTLGSEGDQISIATSNSSISGIITTGDAIYGNAFEFKNGNAIVLVSDTNDSGTSGVDATLIARGSSATKTALFDANGDISFYEDTGTTAKLFWDASAESLLLGTDSGDAFNGEALLRMQGATSTYLQMKSATTGTTGILFGDTDDDYTGGLLYSAADDALVFTTNNGNERLRIDTSGNVGIGTDSPAYELDVSTSSGEAYIRVDSATDQDGGFRISENGTNKWLIYNDASADALAFYDNANVQERMRIDSSGNVGIGTDSPAKTLDVRTSTGSDAVIRVGSSSSIGIDVNVGTIEFYSADTDDAGVKASIANLVTGNQGPGGNVDGNLVFSTTDSDGGGNDSPIERMRISNNDTVSIACTPTNWSGFGGLLIGDAVSNPPLGHVLSEGAGSTSTSLGHGYYYDGTNYRRTALNVGQGIYVITGDSGGSIHAWYSNPGGTADGTFTPSEKMRLDNSGNLLVGTTTSHGRLAIGDFSATGANYGVAFVDANDVYFVRSSTTISSSNAHYQFYNTNGNVGSITTSGSATAFNTSSDQRLKENIVDAPSASDDIDAIQVRSFDWKVDGSHQKYGMIAQELQVVVPDAVSAPEDPEEMMGVDYSKLVPMMLKEIQSLRARVAQLEGAN